MENLKPPTGKAYIQGKQENIPASEYTITADGEESRATLGTNKAGDFYLSRNP